MIAIETKYLGPTNHRGSRIVASTCNGQRLCVSAPDHLDGEAAHLYVAQLLADRMGWTLPLIGGGTKAGYVFVFNPTLHEQRVEQGIAQAKQLASWGVTDPK